MSREKPKPDGQELRPLALGVQGDGVTPRSFDVSTTLRFVGTFLEVMLALAKKDGHELQVSGLELNEGSAAFALLSHDYGSDVQHGRKALAIVSGEQEVPQGLKTRVAEAREALEKLPASHKPFFESLPTSRVLVPTSFAADTGDMEVTTIRGVITAVGGGDPTVQITTTDEGTFFARAELDLAHEAAKNLYSDIEATVIIQTAGSKRVKVELEDFELVSGGTPREQLDRWREWFAKAAPGWDEIEDIAAELGRGRHH